MYSLSIRIKRQLTTTQKLQTRLRTRQELRQNILLMAPFKGAYELWNKLPHHVESLFSHDVEYAYAYPSEISHITSDREFYGCHVGNMIFISRCLPKGYYRRYIVYHELIEKDCGIENDLGRHYYALQKEIKLVLMERPDVISDYLTWRRRIERSNFFKQFSLYDIVNSTVNERQV